MASYYKAPTSNYWSTTLNGAINDSDDSIVLTSASGLQSPGVIVVNRQDGSGNNTPSAREVISYTGISTNTLTGCTRNFDNSTARSHADGSLVETMPFVGMWNDLSDGVDAALNSDGSGLHITATASIATAIIEGATVQTLAVPSLASIAQADIPNLDGSDITTDTIGLTSLASMAHIHYNAAKGTITGDSDGATVTFDMDVSNIHTVTLGGNRTLAVSNVDVGQAFVIRLVQDGTGSRTVTWFSTIKWPSGTAPTLSTAASDVDSFGFICTSSGNYDGYIIGQGLS